nr:hypothetical protein BgiMline_003343 [Biomphalaria glabrata]
MNGNSCTEPKEIYVIAYCLRFEHKLFTTQGLNGHRKFQETPILKSLYKLNNWWKNTKDYNFKPRLHNLNHRNQSIQIV